MATTAPGPTSIGGSAGSAAGLGPFGLILGAAGAVMGSIGSYYSAFSERYQLESEALNKDFEASIAGVNAASAELDAQAALQVGKSEKSRLTLGYGQTKATSRVRQAAGGLQAGVGSSAEVQSSTEVAKELDALTVERGALRAAGASRTRAVGFRNQAALARVSAQNLRGTAGSINPYVSALTSLIGGAGQVSSRFLAQTEA